MAAVHERGVSRVVIQELRLQQPPHLVPPLVDLRRRVAVQVHGGLRASRGDDNQPSLEGVLWWRRRGHPQSTSCLGSNRVLWRCYCLGVSCMLISPHAETGRNTARGLRGEPPWNQSPTMWVVHIMFNCCGDYARCCESMQQVLWGYLHPLYDRVAGQRH